MTEICMLAEIGNLETIPKNWIIEQKFDGTRCLLINNKLISRQKNDYTKKFPELKTNFNGILDGEIVIFKNNKPDFNLLQLRTHINDTATIQARSKEYPATFIVFDILKKDGQNLTKIPLKERRELIPKTFDNPNILNITNLPIPSWNDIIINNLEGLMVKNPDSKYYFKRSKEWLKIKYKKETILKFNKYEINPAGITIENKEGIRIQITGIQSKEIKKIIDTKGIIEVEIEYAYMTKNNKYFQPTFKRIKGDI